MTNLDSIFKKRDITLSTKVHTVKAMVFPVVMYGCENWMIIKMAEHRKIDALELWCWRRPQLYNQSMLKEVNSECSLEELMLKLKLQLMQFGYLMQRVNSLE